VRLVGHGSHRQRCETRPCARQGTRDHTECTLSRRTLWVCTLLPHTLLHTECTHTRHTVRVHSAGPASHSAPPGASVLHCAALRVVQVRVQGERSEAGGQAAEWASRGVGATGGVILRELRQALRSEHVGGLGAHTRQCPLSLCIQCPVPTDGVALCVHCRWELRDQAMGRDGRQRTPRAGCCCMGAAGEMTKEPAMRTPTMCAPSARAHMARQGAHGSPGRTWHAMAHIARTLHTVGVHSAHTLLHWRVWCAVCACACVCVCVCTVCACVAGVRSRTRT
jgi:hypothetical protein